MPDQDWRAAGERIDALLATGGPDREELVRLLTGLYGAGLRRLLELLHAHGALTDPVLTALAADDLVASLLLVHDLHPDSVQTRIERALAEARGEVRLIEVTADGVARLRATGGGCGAAARDERIRAAVEVAAPDLTGIEIETGSAVPLIPVSALFDRPGGTP